MSHYHRQTKSDIIDELVKKYKLPKYKIEDVIGSYFELAAFVLKNKVNEEEGKFPTVGIPYLGKFYSPKIRREKRNEAIRAKQSRS